MVLSAQKRNPGLRPATNPSPKGAALKPSDRFLGKPANRPAPLGLRIYAAHRNPGNILTASTCHHRRDLTPRDKMVSTAASVARLSAWVASFFITPVIDTNASPSHKSRRSPGLTMLYIYSNAAESMLEGKTSQMSSSRRIDSRSSGTSAHGRSRRSRPVPTSAAVMRRNPGDV